MEPDNTHDRAVAFVERVRYERCRTASQVHADRAKCRYCTDTGDCTYHAFGGLYTAPSHVIRAAIAMLESEG